MERITPAGTNSRWSTRVGLFASLAFAVLGTWLLTTDDGASRAAHASVRPGSLAVEPPPALEALSLARPLNMATAPKLRTKPIAEVRVGERVPADNPAEEPDLRLGVDVHPPTWRQVHLHMHEPDGATADIVLLRPADFLDEIGVRPGAIVDLDLTECALEGEAFVVSVGPCPPIHPGQGQVVTGTFQRTLARVINLYVERESDPIGVTPEHAMWSEDRQAFVPAGELRVGERLRTLDGWTRVVRLEERPRPETVYNLEIQVHHVYYVTQSGLLTHNVLGCLVKITPENLAQHIKENPGLLAILRDQATRTRAQSFKFGDGFTNFAAARSTAGRVRSALDSKGIRPKHAEGYLWGHIRKWAGLDAYFTEHVPCKVCQGARPERVTGSTNMNWWQKAVSKFKGKPFRTFYVTERAGPGGAAEIIRFWEWFRKSKYFTDP